MLQTDREALICDLAEVYHIYDYRSLPGMLVATLACGLREDSRIRMKLADQRIDTKTAISALILDGVNLLVWSKSKHASASNRPKSVYKMLTNKEDKNHTVKVDKGYGFGSVEELDAAMERINKKGQ